MAILRKEYEDAKFKKVVAMDLPLQTTKPFMFLYNRTFKDDDQY